MEYKNSWDILSNNISFAKISFGCINNILTNHGAHNRIVIIILTMSLIGHEQIQIIYFQENIEYKQIYFYR